MAMIKAAGSESYRRSVHVETALSDIRITQLTSLMGLSKDALVTVSVPGKTQPLRCKRQHPSADADGSPLGGLNAVDDKG